MLLWELLGFSFLILCSALYSGSEAVLMSIGPDRLEQLIQEGGRDTKLFTFMRHKTNELLITILVGNNIVNVWIAAMATAIFARVFGSAAVGMTVFFVTLLSTIPPLLIIHSAAVFLSPNSKSPVRTICFSEMLSISVTNSETRSSKVLRSFWLTKLPFSVSSAYLSSILLTTTVKEYLVRGLLPLNVPLGKPTIRPFWVKSSTALYAQ